MSSEFHFAGTIHIQACWLDRAASPCNDSTLELLLASFAHRSSLEDVHNPRRESAHLFSVRQLNWPASSGADVSLRANMIQLIHDLQAEFDRMESACL